MKTKVLFPMTAVVLLLISACGKATPAPAARSADEIFNSVYTLAAQTSAAQQSMITPQATVTPAPPTVTLFIPTATFHPTLTAASYLAISNACDSAVYVSDVTIPDGTEFAPGTTFTKTWRIQNTGTCAWNEYYSIVFSNGNRMSGEDTAIGKSVDPNEKVDVSVDLTAPGEEGTYTGYWILTNKNGVAFGNYVYVQIIISDTAATSTPTATTETTSTPTDTSVPTLVPAETPTPTSLPTETPDPVIGTPTPTPIDLPTTRPRS